jgi:hypothetical protein
MRDDNTFHKRFRTTKRKKKKLKVTQSKEIGFETKSELGTKQTHKTMRFPNEKQRLLKHFRDLTHNSERRLALVYLFHLIWLLVCFFFFQRMRSFFFVVLVVDIFEALSLSPLLFSHCSEIDGRMDCAGVISCSCPSDHQRLISMVGECSHDDGRRHDCWVSYILRYWSGTYSMPRYY